MGKDPHYDLGGIPADKMREELTAFILHRAGSVSLMTVYGERQFFKKVCIFLQKRAKCVESFCDRDTETWLRQFKGWMMSEGIPQTFEKHGVYGNVSTGRSRLLCYFIQILEFTGQRGMQGDETDKDIWEIENLDIPVRANPIKNYRTVNFTQISQPGIREELKKGIYRNLQKEAIACVQKEMTAMRRLSGYLADRQKEVQSCRDISREVLEEYLTYLKTEDIETKSFHADLNRLRAILESIGKVCGYANLELLFLNRDIPPARQPEFKVYSDSELQRLNAGIVKLDEQIARAMVIHQMLGTRISDTLTLQTDCLYDSGGETIIRIRQMKTKTFEKPVSHDLAELIRRAIAYTEERHGPTKFIFVDDKNPKNPLPYNRLQNKVVEMIHKENLRDDNGRLFGFGSHMYRHYYGVKLTEMHLDDFTIAKLLGHSSVQNVKYYRKMSNQTLADETREVRNMLSEIILQNLDGWEEEYEQIREDAGM
nr:tyrosine-type recombinase/integrase [uncultured Acetatifactor sp.]